MFFLDTARTATSAGYRRIWHPSGIVSETDSSNGPCLSSLHFGGLRSNLCSLSTLCDHYCHAVWVGHGFLSRSLFSPLGSEMAFLLPKSSPWSIQRLCMCGKVAGGSLKSRRAGLVNTHLLKGESRQVSLAKHSSFRSFPQCHYFPVTHKLSVNHASKTLDSTFRASGQYFFSV